MPENQAIPTMKKFFALIILLTGFTAYGQNPIDICIHDYNNRPIKIAVYYADRLNITDSTITDSKGCSRFDFYSNHPEGLYSILVDNKPSVDFFYSGNAFSITTSYKNLNDSLSFNNSSENSDYQSFIKAESEHNRKMDVLKNCIDNFPQSDRFYEQISKKLISEQIDFEVYLNKLVIKNKASVAGNYLNMRHKVLFDAEPGTERRLEFMKQHFFDRISFNDTTLINTNAYSKLAIEYLGLYSNPSLDKNALQAEFIKGIGMIMDKAAENRKVYDFVVKYLIDGFERFGFEDVIQFISDKYIPGTCENETRKSELAGRIEIIKRLAPGNPAPALSGKSPNGKQFSMNDFSGKWKLLIFWASWCPHCMDMLPKLTEIYNSSDRKIWEIIGYSIDSDINAWKAELETQKYPWIQLSELNGWDSKTAMDYGVFATPVFFLINPENQIVAKPANFYEIREALKKNNLL